MADPTDDGPDRVGPYDTREQATADARLTRAMAADNNGNTYAANMFRLREELYRTGVQVGRYDRDVLDSLALNNPELTQVLIGLVARAYESGWRRGSRTATRIIGDNP